MGRSRSRSESRSRSRSRSRGRRRHRSYSHSRSRSPEEGARLHVGDLGIDCSKTELEDRFKKYGPLIEVWLARNPPCFAFIVYRHREDAELAARELDGATLCGGRVRVTFARPRTRGGRGGGGYYGRRRGFDPNLRCYQCGEPGHFSRDCDEVWRYRRRVTRVVSRAVSRSRSRSRSRGRNKRRSRSRSRDRSCSRSRKSRSKSRSRSLSRSGSPARSRKESKSEKDEDAQPGKDISDGSDDGPTMVAAADA